MDWAKATVRRDENHSSLGIGASYIRDLTVTLLDSTKSNAYKKPPKVHHVYKSRLENMRATTTDTRNSTNITVLTSIASVLVLPRHYVELAVLLIRKNVCLINMTMNLVYYHIIAPKFSILHTIPPPPPPPPHTHTHTHLFVVWHMMKW